MFKRLILTALVLGVSVVLFSQVNSDSLPEKYVKKVIIDAKWENGPGEFGLEPIDETHTWQTHLAIDNENNFYIVDANNRRINIYNQNGKFLKEVKVPPEFLTHIGKDTMASISGIGVDSKENILICGNRSGTRIVKINKNGEIVDRYFIKGIYAEEPYFIVGDNGKAYLFGDWTTGFSSSSNFLGGGLISLLELKKIKKSEKQEIGISNKIKNLSSETFKVTNKKNGISSLNLKMIGKNEWIIHTKVFPVPFRVIKKRDREYIIYEDWLGNIKIESDGKILFKESLRNLNNWSFKYPKYGELTVSADALFDKDGNFYLIRGDSTGLKVIKYIINKEVWK